MTFFRPFLTLALVLFLPLAASAEPAIPAAQDNTKLPDLLSLGVGGFDVVMNTPREEAVDFRLEYRWGTSLLSAVNSNLTSWNKWFQLHPFMGTETTSRGQFYGFGGFVFDVLLGRHIVLSPNVAIGFYEHGNGKYLGSAMEFRSTMEAGWRFDNEMRLTAYFGHTSNANTGDINPGAETAGVYLHIPTNVLFGI